VPTHGGEVIAFDDSDDTACDAIRLVRDRYPNDDIVFANGGDRTKKIFQKWYLMMWSLCLV
jgi:hypothetical protein